MHYICISHFRIVLGLIPINTSSSYQTFCTGLSVLFSSFNQFELKLIKLQNLIGWKSYGGAKRQRLI